MFPEPRMYQKLPMPVTAPYSGAAGARTPTTTPPSLASAVSFARSESIASTLAATATLNSSKTTMASSEPPSSAEGTRTSSQSLLAAPYQTKPFVVRNGRTYLADPSLAYPLPVDLPELHRQSLRTLLFFQLFGGPVCSPAFDARPPTRVLEVGCGSGFWSLMCNQFYARQGHRGISFTGMDVAPVGQGASSVSGKSRSRYATTSSSSSSLSLATDKARKDNNATTSSGSSASSTSIRDSKDSKASKASRLSKASDSKDKHGMNWLFVQHDIRRMPWPFADEEFDLVMIKDMSMSIRTEGYQTVIEECIRILQPGGTLELWDSDHALRILRPHIPEPTSSAADDDLDIAVNAGAYILTPNTPLSAPVNHYIDEFNGWVSKALQARSLSFVPCSLAKAMFYQEADALTGAGSRRLAIPLSEIKWEREGVGGVVTKDGKAYIETKGKGRDAAPAAAADQTPATKTITHAQSALRHTALLTVVQMIQGLEPLLREVSGKSQDEWDSWSGKMMNDLLKENGTYMGECLEVGAWWAQKR